MPNQWFKMYGQEYLSDPKMLALSPCERSCWISLLCYASLTEGTVRYLNEPMLMATAGLHPSRAEWKETEGVLEKFKKLGMVTLSNDSITVLNWKKRQESYLTGAERAKRYRARHAGVTDESDDSNARVEKSRVEENRTLEGVKSIKYLSAIPKEDLEEIVTRFDVSAGKVRSVGEDLMLYCQRKGKIYKNYKAFLINAIKRDHRERPKAVPRDSVQEKKLTPEEEKKAAENFEIHKKAMTDLLAKKHIKHG